MEFPFKIFTLIFIFCTVFGQTTSSPLSPAPVSSVVPYGNFESPVCLDRYASISQTCGATVSRNEDGDVHVEIPSAPCCDILRKVKCMVDTAKADAQCSAELLPEFYYFQSRVTCTEEQCTKVALEKTCANRYGDIGQACGATVTRTEQGVQVEITYLSNQCCEGYRKAECMQTQANTDTQCSGILLPKIYGLENQFSCTRAQCDNKEIGGHNGSQGTPRPLLTGIILGLILACLSI